MKLKNWRETGSYFDYKGFPIFYHSSAASEEVLLCLHGFPSASFDYHKIWNFLSEKFALLSFDMIGYGFSAKPSNFGYTTFNQADVLQALIEHLKIKKVHVLAHDYGNTITLELLAREAEKRLNFEIETVCFLNGALFPETHRPVLAQKILISRFGFFFARMITDSMFKKNLASIFGKNTQPIEAELEDFLRLFKFNDGKRIAHKLVRYMSEREKYRRRWLGALQTMRQPFRFINGLEDKISGAHLVERFRELVPHQTDIIELENIGHYPHFEAPEMVTEKFFKFQQRQVQSSRFKVES